MSPAPAPNAFARMVRLVQERERLLSTLGHLRRRQLAAYSYLSEPAPNVDLVAARLATLKADRAAVINRLDAIRAEAAALLGQPVARDPEAEPCPPSAN